jgi:hypothetical protein
MAHACGAWPAVPSSVPPAAQTLCASESVAASSTLASADLRFLAHRWSIPMRPDHSRATGGSDGSSVRSSCCRSDLHGSPASRGRFARLGAAGLCDARSRTDEGVHLARRNIAIHESLSRLHHARTLSRLLHVPMTRESPDGPTVRMRTVSAHSLPVGQRLPARAENISCYRNSPSREDRASLLVSFPRSVNAAIIVPHCDYARAEIERNVQKCDRANLKQHEQLAICRSASAERNRRSGSRQPVVP